MRAGHHSQMAHVLQGVSKYPYLGSIPPTAASDRYSLHLTFNVKITKPDGSVQSYAVNDCLYEGQPIPTHGLLDIHTFTWNCGDEVELSNFYMAWQSNSGKDCDVNPSKCYSELGPFIIDAPL